jgi:hypothetical protein
MLLVGNNFKKYDFLLPIDDYWQFLGNVEYILLHADKYVE